MYRLGDKVIYPGHGVAVVEQELEKMVDSKKLKFFKLKFLYKDMTVLVPIDASNNAIGIRPLSAKNEIEKALNELYKETRKLENTDFTPSSWNKRNKSYQLKLQGGTLTDIASIYRDLMHIAKYKELSFGEKNLLHVAEELLLQEIVVVKGQDKETVMKELRRPFKHFGSVPVVQSSPTV